ncbi:MAG: transposase [Bdellovibrionales bacterium]|nr:transposase [Massilia sp.]
MSHFINTSHLTCFLMPPSVDEWLPQDHLARFIVEATDGLDLSKLVRQYTGRGSRAHHPATMLGLLLYGYTTSTFSSRKIERATYDSVAFRFIAGNTHPDHDTLATFRRRFLGEVNDLFVQVLALATEMRLLKVGTVCVDGTKIHANASRHSALSHGHIEKLEVQLKAEVQELLALAEQADQADTPDGVSLPDELKRREDRLAVMATAKGKLAVRASERYAREKAEYDQKMAARAAREALTGKKVGGKAPAAPQDGCRDSDQINLTDEESRIMPVAGGAFEQCYNAQAAADVATMLVVATGVTQASNDKQQVTPMVATLGEQSVTSGKVTCLIADTGYFSAHNVTVCEAAQIEPLLAVARDEHHPEWRARHTEPAPLPAGATAAQAMSHRLKTKDGRARYALRKQTIEPVFGIIKSVMGFRQFSLRGLEKVRGEWTLVCLAWNLKRMAVLRQKFG